jgi:uncharacterized protein
MSAPAITQSASLPHERIESLDILRGIALLGMYTVHFYDYATAGPRPENQPLWQLLEEWFLDGRAYAMFAMLFGVGFAVQLARADARGESVVPRYLRRLAALAAFGFIAEAILGYNVLFGYALWGLALLPIRRWSTRSLFLLFLFCSAFRPLYNVTRVAIAQGTGSLPARLETMKQDGARFQAVRKQHETDENSPNWKTVVTGRIRYMPQFQWQFNWHPGGSFTLMLAGLLAFRLGIFQDPAGKRRTILALMLAGAASFVIATWVLPLKGAPPMSLDALLKSTTPLGDMSRTIASTNAFMLVRDSWLAFVYIGIVLLLVGYDRAWIQRLAPFAWNGRMALTNYMTQVAFLDITFSPYGLGRTVSPPFILVGAIGLFAVQALFSRWWLGRYRYGPLEWVWRCVTYWRWEPNRFNPVADSLVLGVA